MKDTLYKWRFILIPIGIVVFLTLISFIVMMLWNNLLPDIINVKPINFYQALGIFILCKILFGFGKGGGGMKMKNKCTNYSQEQKEMFRSEMKERMCFKKDEPADKTNPQ